MRTFAWIWLMFLILCLFLDGATLWAVREQLRQGLELALDAGMIAGVSEEDLAHGQNFMVFKNMEFAVLQVLKENLAPKLRNTLELNISLEQDETRAKLKALASVRIPLILIRFVGLEGCDLTVRKEQNYQCLFK